MASIFSTIPVQPDADSVSSIEMTRMMFGSSRSFASSKGFTAEFAQPVNNGNHSHAELLEAFRNQPVIRNNLKGESAFH